LARFAWTPLPNLPKTPTSFADVSYDQMVRRARELAPTLRERAGECERLRRMPDETERDLHRLGLLRAVQPKRVGGAELPVSILVDLCAEIAAACPSTAWNLGNLGSHHWMLGYFPPEAQDELWSVSTDVVIATSLAFPAGRARKVEGGYVVSGRWPLSSGVDNSDWNMLGAILRDRDDGPPLDHRFMLVHRTEYEVIDTWHAMGLCGTGSKDVACKDLFVPEHRSLSAWRLDGKPHPGSSVNPGTLFRQPMLALGPFVLTGMLLGCARGAYDLVVGAARSRNATNTGIAMNSMQAVQLKVAEASALLDTAQLVMREGCRHAWEAGERGAEPSLDDKLRYRRDGAFAAQMCLKAIDIVMNVAGSSGIYLRSDVQRLFRDAHAAAAHVMFSFDLQGTMYGQHALGYQGSKPML
jgi:3-hydroxy-9,10-secoandrosta-1,3,5(10)-triene-9,17-dione monooxygenase